MIEITIPGDPKAQKRHRHTKCGKFTRTYDPSQSDKQDFLAMVMSHAPDVPIQGPLCTTMSFAFPRPKGHYGTGKNAGMIKSSMIDKPHTSRPDFDNLGKLVADALNKALYKDDSQIIEALISKEYSEKPQTCVRLWDPTEGLTITEALCAAYHYAETIEGYLGIQASPSMSDLMRKRTRAMISCLLPFVGRC